MPIKRRNGLVVPPNCKERAKIIVSRLGHSLEEGWKSRGMDPKGLLAGNGAVKKKEHKCRVGK